MADLWDQVPPVQVAEKITSPIHQAIEVAEVTGQVCHFGPARFEHDLVAKTLRILDPEGQELRKFERPEWTGLKYKLLERTPS